MTPANAIADLPGPEFLGSAFFRRVDIGSADPHSTDRDIVTDVSSDLLARVDAQMAYTDWSAFPAGTIPSRIRKAVVSIVPTASLFQATGPVMPLGSAEVSLPYLMQALVSVHDSRSVAFAVASGNVACLVPARGTTVSVGGWGGTTATANVSGFVSLAVNNDTRTRILEASESLSLDDATLAIAHAAISDAMRLMDHVHLSRVPEVSIGDDGLLVLQWRRNGEGVALLFAGDDTVSVAIRSSDVFYAESAFEVAVDTDLPSKFYSALSRAIG